MDTDTLDTEYYLTDALGSVRQLTDQTGAVAFAQTYDPYGVVTTSTGPSASGYGFTGEYQQDGLVYLRARHYAPGMGRFLTRDTWSGNANRPLSLNRWGYVEGNPVNYTDPTGYILCGPDCIRQGAGQINAPEVLMYDEKQAPNGITFAGSPLTPPTILYDRNCMSEREVQPGTDQSQFIPSRCEPTWPLDRDRRGNLLTYHSGLCGELSIAALLMGLIPGLTANDVVDDFMMHRPNVAPDYTGSDELRKFINTRYSKYMYAWSAQSVADWGGYERLIKLLPGWLNSGYVVAGIWVNGNSGQLRNGIVDARAPNRPFRTEGIAKHWIVITGISNEWNIGSAWQWVRIYNPFDNQTEHYWWADFQSSWQTETGSMLRITMKNQKGPIAK